MIILIFNLKYQGYYKYWPTGRPLNPLCSNVKLKMNVFKERLHLYVRVCVSMCVPVCMHACAMGDEI